MNDELFLETLGVLSESARYKILSLIASRGELTAKDILAEFDFTQPTLSHHMSCLKDVGLVDAERKGRFIYYSVNKETVGEIIDGIALLKGSSEKNNVETDASAEAEKEIKKSKKKKKKDKSKKKKKD